MFLRKATRASLTIELAVGLAVTGCQGPAPDRSTDNAGSRSPVSTSREGYVLKRGEGELLFDDSSSILKASPASGTQGSLLIYDEMPGGSTSGIHYHVHADELFYVLEGRGIVTLATREIAIQPGDVIVVPAGQDHRITSSQDLPLTVVYFLDRPGLEEQFRLERRVSRDTMSIEAFNAIARQYGTVYKTFK